MLLFRFIVIFILMFRVVGSIIYLDYAWTISIVYDKLLENATWEFTFISFLNEFSKFFKNILDTHKYQWISIYLPKILKMGTCISIG